MADLDQQDIEQCIAVIGMSGRFPGADDIYRFWQNLCQSVESLSRFDHDQLKAEGVDGALYRHPDYVPVSGVIAEPDGFDADFFGYRPSEAAVIDPQQRLLLECAYDAMQNAGLRDDYDGIVGVFAGCRESTYLLNNLLMQPQQLANVDGMTLQTGNGKDFVATRVSYKLNLTGPSMSVGTACSTSLVAIHQAWKSLLNFECDIALAGGVALVFPHNVGYLYQQGNILSPDGHCRAFDHNAAGTVGGNGVGIVVLKRAEDAINDGDRIDALVRGSAINNDGNVKVGYTSPAVDGQAQVIAQAQAVADIDPDTISYIETHGTGTHMGDPIEIAALKKAFEDCEPGDKFCALGALKSNIGHLDVAAGVAGFIKTVLMLKHRTIPATLHFEQENPQLELAESPFYVVNQNTQWPALDGVRRAGISSFGIGGTNAHVILEEYPQAESGPTSQQWQILPISNKSPQGIGLYCRALADCLGSSDSIELQDVAFTLQHGRDHHECKHYVVAKTVSDAIEQLGNIADSERRFAKHSEANVVFMFPGQGTQQVNMGKTLYQQDGEFKAELDSCAELLQGSLNLDIRSLLFPQYGQENKAGELLDETRYTQPVLFAFEYALAKQWMAWGVTPSAFIGHSLGEYVAACLSGVFSLEDALNLVAKRGQLVQSLGQAAMLSVALSPQQLTPHLTKQALSAVNAPDRSVVSGTVDDIAELQTRLEAQSVQCRLLRNSYGFHSSLMTPILQDFAKLVQALELKEPQTPFISNVYGRMIEPGQATSPQYWVDHLRQTVLFADGLNALAQMPDVRLLEVGPGRVLSSFAGLTRLFEADSVIESLAQPRAQQDQCHSLVLAAGALYAAGASIDFSALPQAQDGRLVDLPGYAFVRKSYFIAPPQVTAGQMPGTAVAVDANSTNIYDWQWLPQPLNPDSEAWSESGCWLILSQADSFGNNLVEMLTQQGQRCIVVSPGDGFADLGDSRFTVSAHNAADYVDLVARLNQDEIELSGIVHGWTLSNNHPVIGERPDESRLNLGYRSLYYLVQALQGARMASSLPLWLLTSFGVAVSDGESVCPATATALGLCPVLGQEYSFFHSGHIDIGPLSDKPWQQSLLLQQLRSLMADSKPHGSTALRGRQQYHRQFIYQEPQQGQQHLVKRDGCYLITGGLGNIGLSVAKYLYEQFNARLILCSRRQLPAVQLWPDILAKGEADDSNIASLRRLQPLIEAGAEIELVAVDLADQGQVQQAIAGLAGKFDKIHGVFHCAANIGTQTYRMVSDMSVQHDNDQFAAKVVGLHYLDNGLQQQLDDAQLPDFAVLFSSVSTVLGGMGFGAYAAANQYLNGFAQANQGAFPYYSLCWDGWAVAAAQAGENEGVIEHSEGIAALNQLLCLQTAAVTCIVKGDLQDKYRTWVSQLGSQTQTSEQVHERPEIETDYQQPEGELEQQLGELWQQLFSITKIGRNDDFFALGGDSLLLTRLQSMILAAFDLRLEIKDMFAAPTIAGLAELILAELLGDVDADSLDALLNELE